MSSFDSFSSLSHALMSSLLIHFGDFSFTFKTISTTETRLRRQLVDSFFYSESIRTCFSDNTNELEHLVEELEAEAKQNLNNESTHHHTHLNENCTHVLENYLHTQEA